MAQRLPPVLDNPIFRWELLRATRRPWLLIATYGYLACLLLQFFAYLPEPAQRSPNVVAYSGPFRYPPPPPVRLALQRQELAAKVEAAGNSVSFLLYEQLLLIMLITPAVTAGALGYEKEGNTLEALLCTDLASREIVAGKFLGRMCVLARILCLPLPLLIIWGGFAGMGLARILLALLVLAALAFFLAAACMLTAVWTRRTSDAILGCYAMLIILFLVYQTFLGSTWLGRLDPIILVHEALAVREPIQPFRFILLVSGLACAGGVCLALAATWLRAASSQLVEKRPARWLWAFRPSIGNAPVRWRERHVLGLAPLPWLRIIPGWLAKLGVLSFAVILPVTSFWPFLWYDLQPALQGDFALTYHLLRQIRVDRISQEVSIMGFVLLLIASVVVGVRCGNCISEEKRRKTWEDLIMTALSKEEIIDDKRWGILLAAIPYLIVYMVPMFGLSAVGDGSAIPVAVGWATATCVVIAVVASVATGYVNDAEQKSMQRSVPPNRISPRRPQHRPRDLVDGSFH
jgi:ABC-type transport system involved in multi-copper enzyme maturation permease subunit